MPLKRSRGNMYDWTTHTHVHLAGECMHKCCYCYVDNPRFGRPGKYKGEPRLIEEELLVDYGRGKTIFVENCGDVFAQNIPQEFIDKILTHCRAFPDNEYVFQTKNPRRYLDFIYDMPNKKNCFLGTTIETNRDTHGISNAPPTIERFQAMRAIKEIHTASGFPICKTFITIEPILDFDVSEFSRNIIFTQPDFINIGADSKGHGLKEPSVEKVVQLVEAIQAAGIEIRKKHNLERIVGDRFKVET